MKRLSHIHMVPPPRLSMITTPRLSMSTTSRLSMSTTPRLSMSRDPFRDCSNHWKRLYPQHTHTQTYLCFYWHNKIPWHPCMSSCPACNSGISMPWMTWVYVSIAYFTHTRMSLVTWVYVISIHTMSIYYIDFPCINICDYCHEYMSLVARVY